MNDLSIDQKRELLMAMDTDLYDETWGWFAKRTLEFNIEYMHEIEEHTVNHLWSEHAKNAPTDQVDGDLFAGVL